MMHPMSVCLALALALPLLQDRDDPPTGGLDPEITPHVDDFEGPSLEVGNKRVQGRRISDFDGRWRMGEGEGAQVVREWARGDKLGNKRILRRGQVWPMGGPVELHTELTMDPRTLEVLSYQHHVQGLPEGAGIGGGLSTIIRWEFEGPAFTRTVGEGEDAKTEALELDRAMFDGNALGLILAALPLKDDYSAKLPVAMSLNLSPELTRYWVGARVTGKESIPRDGGRDLEAWIVDTAWFDYGSGALTSPGGATRSGGAYWVLTDPPKGVPHVLRYRNDTSRIDWVQGE